MTDIQAAPSTAEPRPKTATKEMRRAAAERIIDRLGRSGHLTEAERAPSVDDLAAVGERHMDGYQIAKRLDERGWDCDLQMADELDGFVHELDAELRKAERAWFERVRPAPPFPDGTRVAFGRGETGVIDRVSAHDPAKYAIKVDGDAEAHTAARRRRIVNFEDVRAEVS